MSKNGGIQRVLHSLAEGLNKENDIYICTQMEENETSYYSYDDDIRFIYLGQYIKRKDPLSRFIRKFCRKYGIVFSKRSVLNAFYDKRNLDFIENILMKYKFDCVIGIQGYYSILLSQINRKKLMNTKIYGWVHNTYEAYFETPGLYYYGEYCIAKKYLKNLDGIITLTKHDEERYRNEFDVKAHCIYNPLSFKEIHLTDYKRNHLFFVGRLYRKQKGLDYLIDILKRIFMSEVSEKWDCWIIGDGPDSKWLKSEIINAGIENRVILWGERDDVQELYGQASLLLSTSRWEGFGLVVTEAFSSGVPVVAFNNSGPAEIIYNGINGILVDKYDVEKFAEKTLDLMKDSIKLKQYSHKAIERSTDFNIEHIVEQWNAFLSKVD